MATFIVTFCIATALITLVRHVAHISARCELGDQQYNHIMK